MSGFEVQTEKIHDPQMAFTDRLHDWQLFFAGADEETTSKNLEIAQQELDELWPYMGKQCLFSGMAICPRMESEDDSDVYESSGPYLARAQDSIGTSLGVTINRVDEGPPEFLFDFFLVAEVDNSNPTCISTKEYHAFLKANGEVVPIESIEEAFTIELHGPAVVDRAEFLASASDNLVNMLRSTGFRRKSHDRQRRIITNYLQQVEEISAVRGEEIFMEAEYAFKNRLHDGRMQYDYRNLGDTALGGVCYGLDTLESLNLLHKAIRRDMDMVYPRAGLCLVIEDMTGQDESENPHGEILYVPISGQKLEVIFGSDYDGYKEGGEQ
jgi:hypothetical protein